jgi:hypothetical protein
MQEAERRHGFILESMDVDTVPGLAAQYGSQVPVVMLNGKLRFRGAVNQVLLERLLDAEKARATRALDERSPPSTS